MKEIIDVLTGKAYHQQALIHDPWLWETRLLAFGRIVFIHNLINLLAINHLQETSNLLFFSNCAISIIVLGLWIMALNRHNLLLDFGQITPRIVTIQFTIYWGLSLGILSPVIFSYFHQDLFHIPNSFLGSMYLYISYLLAIFIYMNKRIGFAKLILYSIMNLPLLAGTVWLACKPFLFVYIIVFIPLWYYLFIQLSMIYDGKLSGYHKPRWMAFNHMVLFLSTPLLLFGWLFHYIDSYIISLIATSIYLFKFLIPKSSYLLLQQISKPTDHP